MKTNHIFISYSRLDDTTYKKHTKEKSAVDVILSRLRKEGIKYWIDREGKYCGEDFEEVIVDALNNSEMLLFISSFNSNTKSEWVVREIKNASKKKKKIIPLLIDDTPFSKSFELTLEGIDNRLYYKNPKEAMDNVVDSIKEHVEAIKKKEEEALSKAKEEENRRKKEEERIREAEAEKKRIEKLEEELGRIHTHLTGAISKQQYYLNKWIAKRKELPTVTHSIKKCPICKTESEDNMYYCDVCGWYFGFPEELIPSDLRQQYDDRLATSLIFWEQKKDTEANLQALKVERDAFKTKLDTISKELMDTKAKIKCSKEESNVILNAKQNEITRLQKELNENRSQLSVVQKKLEELIAKSNEKTREASLKQPIAFLLVTEFGQPNVYLLHEGSNIFGAMSPQNQSPGYQMLVVTEEQLMPRHFEIQIENVDKKLEFRVRPLSDSCHMAYNSTLNVIKAEQVISIGDILYIGNVKIQIIDNFNK